MILSVWLIWVGIVTLNHWGDLLILVSQVSQNVEGLNLIPLYLGTVSAYV